MMDRGASVLERLKSKSKATGKSFQLYLQLFCQEEFLRRLSLSKYADNLILKGGMFIYTLTNFKSRATVDIDFLLSQMSNSVEEIQKMIDEIIAVDTGNSFIKLFAKSFETISTQRKYKGVSFQLIGQIRNTRTPFNVDLGVGDVIVPNPQKRSIPVQLNDFSIPSVMTYSLESTIAEKFDAILQRMELTSRMKDFYDIYYLSNVYNFNGLQLQKAIQETLVNRGTPHERNSLDKIIALGHDPDIQVHWRQYLRRTKLPELMLDQALFGINTFLRPVWETINSGEELSKTWNAEVSQWV